MNVTPVGEIQLQWGESLVWDDRRQRLYFVDCATQTLHWLDDGAPPLHSLELPSLPTGLVPTEEASLVIALADGLHVVDADAGHIEMLSPYPRELGLRANDAGADLDGNLVTGTLNVVAGEPGSYWWFSAQEGWRLLDDGIGNANGPVVLPGEDRSTLVFADTLASKLYAYDYDGVRGLASGRRVFAHTQELGGIPDGACADADGKVWSCILGAGKIARLTLTGAERTIDVGVEQPSDVVFGGPDLNWLYFVSIAIPLAAAEIKSPHAGALMVVEGLGVKGRPEPRFRL